MKLLMLNNEFPPLGGGTATVNYELLTRFAKYPELKIHLITSNNSTKKEVLSFAPSILITKLPINSQCLHHATNLELIKYSILARQEAQKLRKKEGFNLAFAWSAVPAGAVTCFLPKLPYIVRVCGPDLPGFEKRYQWIYPFISPIIKKTLLDAELVIAKCDGEVDLVKKCAPNAKVKIIQNGVDTSFFYPKKDLQTPRANQTKALNIISVGRLIERKGQRTIFKALSLLKESNYDFKLHLVGTGDSEKSYREEVSKLKLENFVTFHGAVPREKIVSIYQLADVFVLASDNEGMSVATLEAMACGLPLITTSVPGSELLVKDGDNGFIFQVNDFLTLKSHLKNLADNPTLLEKMGKNSLKKATLFSWDSICEKYLEIFFSSI
jgi:phosphatidyl-myo-inositol dimannoside synthase